MGKKENKTEEELNVKNTPEQLDDVDAKARQMGDEDAVGDTGEEKELSVEEQLAEAQKEISCLKDQYLRKVAEFENYRKRTSLEKVELIRNGGKDVIVDMLPVLDDIERAQASIDNADNLETLKEGVSLIIKKLQGALSAHGLKAIETEDKDFDTDYHEAIAMVPVEDGAKKGKVIDCVTKGYTLNDTVIRYAKVAVGQ